MKRLAQTNYLRLRERSLMEYFLGGMFLVHTLLILSSFTVAEIHCQRQTLPYECIATTTSLVIQERVKIPLSVLRQAKFGGGH
ncbi:MAG: hypothetical protein KatS3mg067_0718 [Thermosynechococcus sp.]|nr:MAG: hypothetical protein KatS3mg067_0718 [Thermosynechococcus sp.]